MLRRACRVCFEVLNCCCRACAPLLNGLSVVIRTHTHTHSQVIRKLEGTVDESELIDGVIFDKKVSHTAGGADRVSNAKIALVQFCLSPPKTDLDNQIIVSDYAQMDRVLREERQ